MSVPRKVALDVERVAEFLACLADGRIQPGVTYTAGELARIVGWNPKTVKRLVPVIVAAQKAPYAMDWEVKEGPPSRYFFRAISKSVSFSPAQKIGGA